MTKRITPDIAIRRLKEFGVADVYDGENILLSAPQKLRSVGKLHGETTGQRKWYLGSKPRTKIHQANENSI